jgi:hypothetical protein
MKRLSIDSIKSYFEIKDKTCISIYMPAHRMGTEFRQDQIRFKNLTRQTEDQLRERGYRKDEIDTLMKPVHALRDNTPLWQHMSDGFVIFRSENHFSYNQFPIPFKELALVQHRFHLKPLIPLLTGNGLYYVLGLSQNKISLFEGTKHSLKEIEADFLPENLAKALNIDEFFETKQFHTSTAGTGTERAAVFHGHGGVEEDRKQLIRQYFREINKNLTPFLTDRQVPLVLAGVEYLHPIYHEINDHQGLLKNGVNGNPDQYSTEELHKKSWDIVSSVFNGEVHKARIAIEENLGTKRIAIDLDQVLKSAEQGRVETLFIARNEQVWGRYDEKNMELRLETKDETPEDLLDLCAVKTLINGGAVFSLDRNDIPKGYQTAALLRY